MLGSMHDDTAQPGLILPPSSRPPVHWLVSTPTSTLSRSLPSLKDTCSLSLQAPQTCGRDPSVFPYADEHDMSDPSYRLAKHRSRPTPLHFDVPSSPSQQQYSDSPYKKSGQDSPSFLYDLPTTTSISPPPSPFSGSRLTSPVSPSFSRSGTPSARRVASGSRNRSSTPPRIPPGDLEKFAEHCKAWYFSQDDEAGRLMTQILASILPSQRAAYSRIQASTRSAYHKSVSVRRAAEFRAHLSATQPGGSLTAHARANPQSSAAKKERLERFDRFLRAWCTQGMPGPQPFFKSLHAIFTLQTRGGDIGGAGSHRVEWEFDDAVFKEAAGKDFMLEAIDMLKGVLGFEEYLSPSLSPYPSRDESTLNPPPHIRSQSQPLSSAPTAVRPKRLRAPSDPFLDTPALSRSVATASSQSSGLIEPTSPLGSTFEDLTPRVQPRRLSRPDLSIDDLEDVSLRTWIAPDLSDVELFCLLKLFPPFVAKQIVPRFPPAKLADVEQGLAGDSVEERQVKCGTGVIWMGPRQRSEGWRISWWTRLALWFKRTFF